MPTTSQVIARRIGRIAFGGVLFVGVIYMGVACIHARWSDDVSAARIIVATWLCAGVAGATAQRVAARLRLSRRPDWLFAESLMAPAAGIAMLLPLTLHMPVVLLLGSLRDFDEWVLISIVVTGLAHVVFAITTALRAYQLATGRPAWSPRKIYVVTLIASCVPFVVLVIPPLLVATTGLACVPLLTWMERIAARERAELESLPQPLPRAIAVRPS